MVGEVLREHVGVPLALRHIVVEGLIEALGDAEGLLEAVATTEGGVLPLGVTLELGVKDPLRVTVGEGESDDDEQRDADGDTLGVSVALCVAVGDTLRERRGVPEVLGHGDAVPLTEEERDAEPHALGEPLPDGELLPLMQ
jgi:hypothetical protein